jgi:hypothetical protein
MLLLSKKLADFLVSEKIAEHESMKKRLQVGYVK